MNKELIKKYKVEFDHHLNDGEVLFCRNNDFSQWFSARLAMWESNEPSHVIIDDKYTPFRKAIAEGKTVQYQGVNGDWYDITDNFGVMKQSKMRIKPDEPNFKEGDWVRVGIDGDTPSVLKQFSKRNYDECKYTYVMTDATKWTDIEPWEAQEGEWCWYHGVALTPVLIKYVNHSISKCEPFIGTLPSILKER